MKRIYIGWVGGVVLWVGEEFVREKIGKGYVLWLVKVSDVR